MALGRGYPEIPMMEYIRYNLGGELHQDALMANDSL